MNQNSKARVKVVLFALAVAWTAVISLFVVTDNTFADDGAQVVASVDGHSL